MVVFQNYAPKYYQLRNYALDFLFNRLAHDDLG